MVVAGTGAEVRFAEMVYWAAAVLYLVVLGVLWWQRDHLRTEVVRRGAEHRVADDLAFSRLPVVWWCFGFFLLSTMTLAVVQTYAVPILQAVHAVPLPTATVSGVTRAFVRDGTKITSGSLDVLARYPDGPVVYTATATSFVLGIGGLTGAGIATTAVVDGIVEAYIGAPPLRTPFDDATTVVAVSGAITVKASSRMRATSTADNVAVGAINIGAQLPKATVSGQTRAYVGQGADVTGSSGLLLVFARSADW